MKPNINNANLRDCRTSILPILRPFFALRQLAKYDVPLLRKAWLVKLAFHYLILPLSY
jgi:hypothetical protein